MFNKNKTIKKEEPFALNHFMKDEYSVDNLYGAKLHYLSSQVNEAMIPIIKKTNLTFIFEKKDGYYEEVFTGLKVGEEPEYFNYPYIVNVTPITQLKKDLKQEKISKFLLLRLINDINTKENSPKEKGHSKKYNKNRRHSKKS